MTRERDNAIRPATRTRTARRHAARLRRPMPRHGALACACIVALCSAQPARADAVTDWNTVASQNTPLPLPLKLRAMAMVQIAVHDALNAIDPRYTRYSVVPAAAASAQPDAAVATAARDVLLVVAPASQHVAIGLAHADALSAIPGCPASPACQQGIAAGQAAAAAILAERSIDGAQGSPHLPYTPAPAAGVYQPTPDMNPAFPAFANWANVRPFTAGDGASFHARFRAPRSPLLDLRSFSYTVDYWIVKTLGSKQARAAQPDSDPSRSARFWYGSAGGDWAGLAQGITRSLGLDPWENARLYALIAIGQADVTISAFEGKYRYNFWRPVTAIRWNNDGNPATPPDPAWTPYLATPAYPDYPCGTPMLAGAATEVLRNFLGTDKLHWSATSMFPGQPGVPAGPVTRRFRSFSHTADEVAMSRVYAGIHFGTGCRVGVEQGEKIGRYAFERLLLPL